MKVGSRVVRIDSPEIQGTVIARDGERVIAHIAMGRYCGADAGRTNEAS